MEEDGKTKKSVGEFEREHGLMLHGDVNPEEVITFDEFRSRIAKMSDFTGVDHEMRTQWLQDNGYDVTRENMMDATLPSKQAQEEAQNG